LLGGGCSLYQVTIAAFSVENKKIHETPQSWEPVKPPHPQFEMGTSRIQVWSIIATQTSSVTFDSICRPDVALRSLSDNLSFSGNFLTKNYTGSNLKPLLYSWHYCHYVALNSIILGR
jgi:hypothetical protein